MRELHNGDYGCKGGVTALQIDLGSKESRHDLYPTSLQKRGRVFIDGVSPVGAPLGWRQRPAAGTKKT
jgi:hypothetical protein